MNVLLFIAIVIASFIIVRIGAIAFQLTGLEWSLAKFQALSCFTGTGFTTREAELITGNPQRRRIATVLMILGNAGLVVLIATFANSLRPSLIVPKFEIPFLHLIVPARILPWVNLLIIIITFYLVYKIVTRTKFLRNFTLFVRKKIIKKEIIKPVSFEELMVSTGGYVVSNIEIIKNSLLLNKTITQTKLKENDIIVLVKETCKMMFHRHPEEPKATKDLGGKEEKVKKSEDG
ncbi:MAG: hypothetical protein ABH869_03970 [Candidatus Omnitrophota bacterium]